MIHDGTGRWRGRWFLTHAALGILCIVPCAGWAGDWPGWRGPTGLGYTEEKDLPLTWDAKTNIVWKSLLHGGSKENPDFTSPGWSSPIVWKDRVFLTTATWPGGLTDKDRRAVQASCALPPGERRQTALGYRRARWEDRCREHLSRLKAKALAACEVTSSGSAEATGPHSPDILTWLESL
jgi:hypothetical protein